MVKEFELEVNKLDNLKNGTVKYCKGCGTEWDLDKELCCKDGWLSPEFNSAMKRYVELYKIGELSNHYDKAMKNKGGARMNKKRMIHYLLNHKDKIIVDEKIVNKIISHL